MVTKTSEIEPPNPQSDPQTGTPKSASNSPNLNPPNPKIKGADETPESKEQRRERERDLREQATVDGQLTQAGAVDSEMNTRQRQMITDSVGDVDLVKLKQ